MKHAKRLLACLLAGVLTLAVFTGCSGFLNFATVQTSTDDAKALMNAIDPALEYDDRLEYAAQRLADWMAQEPLQLGTENGQFLRRVPLTADSGNMAPGITVNEFIDRSTDGLLYLSSNVKIGMTMNNEGNPYYDPGRLYAPAMTDAAQTLSSYAEGCSKMGAVFIQYNGETYVVALFL